MSPVKPPRKRASAPQMEVRKFRIIGWLQAGLSYEEIAGQEEISRRRVRQIVVEALKERDEDRSVDRQLLNEVRLAPAMRLAAKAIVEGKLEGIGRLISVINRLEKLQGPTPRRAYDENARAKLLAKLSIDRSSVERNRTAPRKIEP
jgi:hypothetical protein